VPTQPGSPAPFSLETWQEEGKKLVEMGHALHDSTSMWQLAVGDWFVAGESFLGEEAYGYIDLLGFSSGALRQYAWVAAKVEPDTRVTGLDYSHFRAVAALEPPEQKEWLEKAQEKNLTWKDLYREIHGEKPRAKRWSFAELEPHLCTPCREALSLLETG